MPADLAPRIERIGGRTPVDPQFKLTVWLYASLIGLHHESEVARALKTDAALKEFRRENGKFLEAANGQVLALAIAERIVDPQARTVDNMRLRADAATARKRTWERSERLLRELARVDTSAMPDENKAAHAAKVARHETAVARCEAEGRTGHSVTDSQATLMKFPSGASLPGHRVTVVGSGTAERFIVKVQVDGGPTNSGRPGPAVAGARDTHIGAGIPVRKDAPAMQVAADAGYRSQADLEFAFDERHAGRIDVVLPEATPPTRNNPATGEPLFGRDEFLFDDTDEVVCPSGRLMYRPYKMPDSGKQWRGRDCETCPLESACTTGKQRVLATNPVTGRDRPPQGLDGQFRFNILFYLNSPRASPGARKSISRCVWARPERTTQSSEMKRGLPGPPNPSALWLILSARRQPAAYRGSPC